MNISRRQLRRLIESALGPDKMGKPESAGAKYKADPAIPYTKHVISYAQFQKIQRHEMMRGSENAIIRAIVEGYRLIDGSQGIEEEENQGGSGRNFPLVRLRPTGGPGAMDEEFMITIQGNSLYFSSKKGEASAQTINPRSSDMKEFKEALSAAGIRSIR